MVIQLKNNKKKRGKRKEREKIEGTKRQSNPGELTHFSRFRNSLPEARVASSMAKRYPAGLVSNIWGRTLSSWITLSILDDREGSFL